MIRGQMIARAKRAGQPEPRFLFKISCIAPDGRELDYRLYDWVEPEKPPKPKLSWAERRAQKKPPPRA